MMKSNNYYKNKKGFASKFLMLVMIFCVILIIVFNRKINCATINSVDISPDPFGPIPGPTTTISINLSAIDDYVNIIYDQNGNIVRRLQNRIAPGVNFNDTWDGTDDFGIDCSVGTYDIQVKVSRTGTYSTKMPYDVSFLELSEPRDIACDKNGSIYVVDRSLCTVQKFAPNGTLLLKFGTPGTGNGQFNRAWGITVDTNFNIFVSDESPNGTGRVQKFDSTGNYITSASWGGHGTIRGMGIGPDQSPYFCSQESDDIVRLNNSTLAITGTKTYLHAVANPVDVAVGTNGDVYVVNGNGAGNGAANRRRRIRQWTAANFNNINAPDNETGDLNLRHDSITIRSNYIYVVERNNDRIEQRGIQANVGNVLETFGTTGKGDGQFDNPSGIAWDPVYDFLWVSDTINMRLQKISDQTGNMSLFLEIVGEPTGLVNPLDIAIDKYGNMYIVGNGHYSVKKFDKFGNFLMKIGGYGDGNGLFRDPRGVAVDNDGYIYISDWGTGNRDDSEDQIEKFDLDGNFVTNWNLPDGRGMTALYRNGTNLIVAIGEATTPGDANDCEIRIYLPDGTIHQSFYCFFLDVDYTDVEIDFLGQFYLTSGGDNYVELYPANASGSIAGDYDNLGRPAGIALDSFGTLWITEQNSDNIEARQYQVYNPPGNPMNFPLLYEFSGQGTADGLLSNPTYCAIKVLNLPGEWAHLWVCDSGNNRLQKFIINWEGEITKQVTIASPGYPQVSAGYPEESNTNVNKYESIYYSRSGVGTTFKILFSQVIDTNIKPTVKFITEDAFEYVITNAFYSNNIWLGRSTIMTGHDGTAQIYVSGAVSSAGSNLSPDPDTSFTFEIDTKPPDINVYQPATPTIFSNIIADGNTEAEIFVDLYNFTTTNGWTAWSSNKNIISDSFGNFSGCAKSYSI